MKLRHLTLPCLAFALAACDRGAQQESQRLAEERAALEREKAQLAAEKAAAQQSANERERSTLEAERASLEQEKTRLAGARETEAAARRDAQLDAERSQRVAAEQKAAAETAARLAAEERERKEREAREMAEKAGQQARSQQTTAFFFDALDPFGDWVQIDRYGYAFRPREAKNPNWRPYTDGSWVYTDYGWTWRSNEAFGWATYHYGRWARVPRLGWVWVPGSEWGPAWISWRRSPDFIGWAPLPPDAWSKSGFNGSVDQYFDIGPGLYTFLRVADFGEATYVGRCVEQEQNVTIINNTTNITNVVYKTVQNRVTIVNGGPDIAVVNKASRKPVARLAIQRVNGVSGGAAKIEGNTLRMDAPQIEANAPSSKPKLIKEEVKADEMDRGWGAGKSRPAKPRGEAPPARRQPLETGTLETRPLQKSRVEPPAAPKPPKVPETKVIEPLAPPAAEAPEPPSKLPDAPNRPNRVRPTEPQAQPQPEQPEVPLKRFKKDEPDEAPRATPVPQPDERRERPGRGNR